MGTEGIQVRERSQDGLCLSDTLRLDHVFAKAGSNFHDGRRNRIDSREEHDPVPWYLNLDMRGLGSHTIQPRRENNPWFAKHKQLNTLQMAKSIAIYSMVQMALFKAFL